MSLFDLFLLLIGLNILDSTDIHKAILHLNSLYLKLGEDISNYELVLNKSLYKINSLLFNLRSYYTQFIF
jgi:hypothetical protein